MSVRLILPSEGSLWCKHSRGIWERSGSQAESGDGHEQGLMKLAVRLFVDEALYGLASTLLPALYPRRSVPG